MKTSKMGTEATKGQQSAGQGRHFVFFYEELLFTALVTKRVGTKVRWEFLMGSVNDLRELM